VGKIPNVCGDDLQRAARGGIRCGVAPRPGGNDRAEGSDRRDLRRSLANRSAPRPVVAPRRDRSPPSGRQTPRDPHGASPQGERRRSAHDVSGRGLRRPGASRKFGGSPDCGVRRGLRVTQPHGGEGPRGPGPTVPSVAAVRSSWRSFRRCRATAGALPRSLSTGRRGGARPCGAARSVKSLNYRQAPGGSNSYFGRNRPAGRQRPAGRRRGRRGGVRDGGAGGVRRRGVGLRAAAASGDRRGRGNRPGRGRRATLRGGAPLRP